MKITLDFIPPTINKYIGKTNIWKYQEDKKQISLLIRYMMLPKTKIKKCSMTITYYFKDKARRDPSNYDKFILDALVDSEIITDDSYHVVNPLILYGAYDKQNPRTEIYIEEIE